MYFNNRVHVLKVILHIKVKQIKNLIKFKTRDFDSIRYL